MTTTMQLLTTTETAAILGLSPRTLDNWRNGDPPYRGPAFLHVGSRVRYRLIDVEAYLESQRRKALRKKKAA